MNRSRSRGSDLEYKSRNEGARECERRCLRALLSAGKLRGSSPGNQLVRFHDFNSRFYTYKYDTISKNATDDS